MKHFPSTSRKKNTNFNVTSCDDVTLRKKKWEELLGWRWLFSLIPFVDFALVAGSMALGEEDENSDFDIILACRENRMFVARICAVIVFGSLKRRRKSTDTKEQSKDKFCFNHFITKDSYVLRPPHNVYWETLYQNLVPLYGNAEKLIDFFFANGWAGNQTIVFDSRFKRRKLNLIRTPLELILGTPLGTPLEKLLGHYQLRRIKMKGDVTTGRLHADTTELELHPDIRRIEERIREEKRL